MRLFVLFWFSLWGRRRIAASVEFYTLGSSALMYAESCFFLLLCADFEHLVTRPTAAVLLSPVLYVRVNYRHALQCYMGEGREARLERARGRRWRYLRPLKVQQMCKKKEGDDGPLLGSSYKLWPQKLFLETSKYSWLSIVLVLNPVLKGKTMFTLFTDYSSFSHLYFTQLRGLLFCFGSMMQVVCFCLVIRVPSGMPGHFSSLTMVGVTVQWQIWTTNFSDSCKIR